MVRININLPSRMSVDLRKYCFDNMLNLQELIRHLIRTEIYIEKSLQPSQNEIKNNMEKEIRK